MARVQPRATPNPNAMKFVLDIALPERIVANRGDDAQDAFTRAVLAAEGVASVFGMNDFVTVTRVPGADWVPIACAVEDAAARHLPECTSQPSSDAVERARALLREALTRPAATPVDIRPDPRGGRADGTDDGGSAADR
jgi:hypothetical protein